MSVSSVPSTTLYPARAGAAPLTAESLWALPRVGAPVAAPDGSFLVAPVTRFELERNSGRTRLWRIPTGGGEPVPLTSPEVSSGEPALSPDGRRLAFTRKLDGGRAQVWVMPLDGGEAQKVTELPLGASDPLWLPDGSGLLCASQLIAGHLTIEATRAEAERRDKDPVKAHVTEERVYRYWDTWLTTGEVMHLFVIDLVTGSVRDLTPASTLWFDWMEPAGQYDVSPDGAEVAFSALSFDPARQLVRSALFTVPVAGGEVRALTPDHPADDVRPRYADGGRSIVYGMTRDPHFYADRVRLMRFDRRSGEHHPLLDTWDRTPAHWTHAPDGRLLFEAENEGRVDLFVLDDGKPRQVVRGGTAGGLTPLPDGAVAFTLQTIQSPAEVFVLEKGAGAPRRLTHFTAPIMDQVSLGEVREMTFEGGYGETVQMFVVLPPGDDGSTKRPLVQVIHGGPHGISGDGFHARWNLQLFAAPGYVAAAVNFQGSTSWGQDFAQRIQGGHGDRPYLDVMRATDVLIESGLVDGNRMAAAGGSYGGYMAAWIAGHTDRFRCIVNHAGVYDTLAQYASDVTQGRAASYGGEPWSGLEAIDRFNPARFTNGFITPMLVIHGERDYRVPATQGLACYGVLKAKGVPARLVYFPDENHWVLKPRNSMLWYREVHGWLARWLG
ncbi:MAG: S9 family peptidase [Candidatus Eisenbacteria bacterium]|uniref:Acyl-peptide hydrolase n=1 Tax=Eiseniibacteriota bacterium TaxID=2212470 RepID=A0A849SQE2_UNCEI|nr:S9 family peptidase [Candidatus Eisenbacteria bacterium]